MSFCVLGSGSAGNCSVLILHYPDQPKPRIILIDLGLGLRDTEARLRMVDLSLHMVDDIILTHFDTDHFRPVWINRLKKMHAVVRFHLNHWPRANLSGALEFKHEPFDDKPFSIAPDCTVNSVSLPHDEAGTTGFRFDTAAGKLGFATDLGKPPKRLLHLFDNLTILALESNYCPELQEESGRPYFLIKRITGGKGHLSNEQSFDTVRTIQSQSPDLRKIILLHLSRDCNSAGRILDVYRDHPDLSRKLIISNQKHPINWINIDTPDHVDTAESTIPMIHTQHKLWGKTQSSKERVPQ